MTLEYLEDPTKGLVSEARPLQLELARYIRTVLDGESRDAHLVEAGTGIGKSYAYLVNAIAEVQRPPNDEGVKPRIIVSTAMKSLQQQLYQKDLPRLQQVMQGYTFKYARQVGKPNHGCKRRVMLNVIDREEQKIYQRFFDETPHWIWDEAPRNIRLPQNHRTHSVAYCNKLSCEYVDACSKKGYLASRAEIEEADILVVNHALVGADIRVQQQHGVSLLGKATVLIVDEAHKLPENLRKALAADMPRKYFDRVSTQFEGLKDMAENSMVSMSDLRAIKHMPRAIPQLARLKHDYVAMFQEVLQHRTFGPSATRFATTCRGSIGDMAQSFGYGGNALKAFLRGAPKSEIPAGLPFSVDMRDNESAMQLLYFMNDVGDKLSQYANAIDMSVRERLKYVVDCDTSSADPKISVIPINIAPALNEHLKQKDTKPLFMSATLALDGRFDHYAAEVGAHPDNSFLAGTPFNYAKQAYGYYPRHLPDPTKSDKTVWATEVARECYELLMANEGHAFVLFTSFVDMNAVAQGLRALGYPYPLLIQNDELKAKAREIFVATPNATLLGTRSFWEGIDIPGLHLSLVIIPKLPFPNPQDALIRAKCEIAGDTWFQDVSLPAMLIDLKQMAGRLIRSTTDLGVVAVLDCRLHTKPYGRRVLNAVGIPKHGTTLSAAQVALGQIKRVRDRRNAEDL